MNTMTREQNAWLDEMVVELRLREVPGAAIGDAVAEVEAHCADSGETPQEAFGDPRAYARSLDLPSARTDAGGWVRLLSPVAAGLVGLMLAPPTVTAVRQGTDVALGWGQLLWFAAFAVLIAAVATFLRAVLDHVVLAAIAFTVAFVALVALPILLPAPAVTLSPLITGVIAAVALVWSVVAHRGMGEIADPVLDPVSQRDRYADDRPRVGAVLGVMAGRFVFVVVTIVLCVVAWVAA